MDRIKLIQTYLKEKRNTTIIHEHYLNTLREYAPGTDLYMREIHFLVAVELDRPVSVSALAQKLEVTLGAASQMATKLEKKGLVSRFPDPEDRRRTMVSLTEEGARLHQQHLEYDQRQMEKISSLFSSFSDQDMERLIEAEHIFQQGLRTRNANRYAD